MYKRQIRHKSGENAYARLLNQAQKLRGRNMTGENFFMQEVSVLKAVSYTHLDVYKRQVAPKEPEGLRP